MNERTYSGDIAQLRRPERMAVLEVSRVAELCIKGMNAASILDAGSGSGIFLEAFSSRGLFCAGIDFNPAMLRAARGFLPLARVAASLADQMPFRDKSFDIVFMAHLLHEVDDPAITLAECRRIAKKRIAVLEWQYRQEEIGPPLLHRLRPDDVGNAAQKAGLQRVKPFVLKTLILYLIETSQHSY
ncbi:MAG TPA: class I SAM-dependent methyltransferase [Chitinivibrionales bacterium]|nr:class I SAM-dependent methyltransferase [Chitinivibrionales bacterium]